jgi:hypothetical protein
VIASKPFRARGHNFGLARVVDQATDTGSLSNSKNRPAPNRALTWRPGQWHPVSDQHHAAAAIPRPAGGFVRSVPHLVTKLCLVTDKAGLRPTAADRNRGHRPPYPSDRNSVGADLVSALGLAPYIAVHAAFDLFPIYELTSQVNYGPIGLTENICFPMCARVTLVIASK